MSTDNVKDGLYTVTSVTSPNDGPATVPLATPSDPFSEDIQDCPGVTETHWFVAAVARLKFISRSSSLFVILKY
jgi:hypothetical protein